MISLMGACMGLTMLAGQPLDEQSVSQASAQASEMTAPPDECEAVSLQQFMREHNLKLGDNLLTRKAPRRLSVEEIPETMLATTEAYDYNDTTGTVSVASNVQNWDAALVTDATTGTVTVENFLTITAGLITSVQVNLPLLVDCDGGTVTIPCDETLYHDEVTSQLVPTSEPDSVLRTYLDMTDICVVPEGSLLNGEDITDVNGYIYDDGSISIEEGFVFITRHVRMSWPGNEMLDATSDTTYYVSSPIYRNTILLAPNGQHDYKYVSTVEPSDPHSFLTRLDEFHVLPFGKKPIKPGEPLSNRPITDNEQLTRPDDDHNSLFVSLSASLGLITGRNGLVTCRDSMFNIYGGKKPLKPGDPRIPGPINPLNNDLATRPDDDDNSTLLSLSNSSSGNGSGFTLIFDATSFSAFGWRNGGLSELEGKKPIKPGGDGEVGIRGDQGGFGNLFLYAPGTSDGSGTTQMLGKDWSSSISNLAQAIGVEYSEGVTSLRGKKPLKPKDGDGILSEPGLGLRHELSLFKVIGNSPDMIMGSSPTTHSKPNILIDDNRLEKRPIKPGDAGILSDPGFDLVLSFFERSGNGFSTSLFCPRPDSDEAPSLAGNGNGEKQMSKLVYMFQSNDTVYVYNLFGRHVMNYMTVKTDGTMDFPYQSMGDDVYNFSYSSGSLSMYSRKKGCTGNVTPEAITWGITSIELLAQRIPNHYFTNNDLHFTNGDEFMPALELNITNVTMKINRLINGEEEGSITDVTNMINQVINAR